MTSGPTIPGYIFLGARGVIKKSARARKKWRGEEQELRDGDSVTLAPPLGEFLRDGSYA